MSRHLDIDVFFEFTCPWCLIGKRQLDMALNRLKQSDPDVEVGLHWHGVQLLPQLPLEGIPFAAFYLKRLGSIEAVQRRQAQIREAAHAVNIDIAFDRIQRVPNTATAHQVFIAALSVGTPEQCGILLERLFAAYFFYSEDLASPVILSQILAECGFTAAFIQLALNNANQPFQSADIGGNGVPYFIFNARAVLAGAASVDVIYQTMLETLTMDKERV